MAKKQQLPAKGRSRGKGKRQERFLTAGIVLALIVIAFALWGPTHKYRHPEEKRPVQAKKAEPAPGRQEAKEQLSKKNAGARETEKKSGRADAGRKAGLAAPAPNGKPPARVAIVIDDLGQDLNQAREIMALPAGVTVAVLPGLAQSRAVAALARQNNREVLLHLPMEYRGKNGKPSPGMLRSDMTPMDFLNTLSDNMASVPGAIGVNNHEGSVLTENKEAMKFLMAELKARDLLFLDSLTSPRSVAYATAREFGVKAARRDVFLDNDSENVAAIQKQLDELARIARDHGHAVGIGHPHPATVAELRAWIAGAARQGIEIVPVSRLVN